MNCKTQKQQINTGKELETILTCEIRYMHLAYPSEINQIIRIVIVNNLVDLNQQNCYNLQKFPKILIKQLRQ